MCNIVRHLKRCQYDALLNMTSVMTWHTQRKWEREGGCKEEREIERERGRERERETRERERDREREGDCTTNETL